MKKIIQKKRLKKNKENFHSEYINLEIPGLDGLLEKGIPKGFSVLISGGAGSGKTLFSLQALVNLASQGKKCLYIRDRLLKPFPLLHEYLWFSYHPWARALDRDGT